MKEIIEKIEGAAILTTHMRVLLGRSHPQIRAQIDYKKGERTEEEGFWTDQKRFVNRKEAAVIFRDSKQETHTGSRLPEDIQELDSDHLYRY